MTIDIVKRLQDEVKSHNELIDRQQAVSNQLAGLEKEIQHSFGRVQILNELAESLSEDSGAEEAASKEEPSTE